MLKYTILSYLILQVNCSTKPVPRDNGVWFPGKSCGIKTEIKYLSEMPADTSNLACTFVRSNQPLFSAPKECIKQGYEYHTGQEIQRVPGRLSSPEKCQKKCQENSKCEVWTYHYKWAWCRLRVLGTPNDGRERFGHVSGPKYCEL